MLPLRDIFGGAFLDPFDQDRIQRRNPSGGSDASNPSDPAYRNETHRLIAKSIQENSMMKEASNSRAHFQTGIDFIDMAKGFSAI